MKFINSTNHIQEQYGYDEVQKDCYIIPDDFDLSLYFQYKGFVSFTVDEDTKTVTGITPNIEAYEAFMASLPKGGYEPTIQERIDGLKAELEASDYKVAKCMEYKLTGKDLPYDIVALSFRRDAIRKQIGALQLQLNEENI